MENIKELHPYELLKYLAIILTGQIFSDQQILKLGANVLLKIGDLILFIKTFIALFLITKVPEQYDGATQVIQSQLSKNFALKNWNISPSVAINISGLTIFRLPEWVGILDFLTT